MRFGESVLCPGPCLRVGPPVEEKLGFQGRMERLRLWFPMPLTFLCSLAGSVLGGCRALPGLGMALSALTSEFSSTEAAAASAGAGSPPSVFRSHGGQWDNDDKPTRHSLICQLTALSGWGTALTGPQSQLSRSIPPQGDRLINSPSDCRCDSYPMAEALREHHRGAL